MRIVLLAFICTLIAASIAQAGAQPAPGVPTASISFTWPLCGPAPKAFGYGTDPFTGRAVFHSGIDLDAPAGAPIRASARGRVIAAETRGPYGNMVEIDHGAGYRTRYGHLAAYRVSPGDIIGRGEVIGDVGSTGRSMRPHLHFEIWYRDVVRDPRKHLEPEPTCMLR
jgi:murein DD-endopeptidase MepM/ murein hydrolase activator NlpD